MLAGPRETRVPNPRISEDIMTDWLVAARELLQAPTGSAEAAGPKAEMERLRREYHREADEVVQDDRP